MNNITKTKMTVKATAGAEISNCIKESIKLSIESDIPVELIHNARIYSCYYKELADQIYAKANDLKLEDAL